MKLFFGWCGISRSLSCYFLGSTLVSIAWATTFMPDVNFLGDNLSLDPKFIDDFSGAWIDLCGTLEKSISSSSTMNSMHSPS